MTKQFRTEQEEFWCGDFGSEYIERCSTLDFLPSRVNFVTNILMRTAGVQSVLELGTNVGLNCDAIKIVKPSIDYYGVEINPEAIEILKTKDVKKIFEGSLLEFEPQQLGKYDFVFTSGVLIHINPEYLDHMYKLLYECSSKYMVISEYFNPTPVEVTYRGHDEKLFKRDFAGEFMDKYPDVELVDYGFLYRRDNNYPGDDVNWFLLRK